MPNSIKTLWSDIKGNAKWSFIQWIFWTTVPAVLTGLIGWFKHAPIWQIWTMVGCVCFICSLTIIFINRNKEERAIKKPFQPDEKSRETLTAIVDLMRSENQLDKRYDPIGALIKYANVIRTQQETKWLCDELVKHHYRHPFDSFESCSNHALRGQWLSFLQEARLNKKEIRIEVSAWDFLIMRWSGREKFKAARQAVLGIDKFASVSFNAEKYKEETIGTNIRYNCRIKIDASAFIENFKLEITDFSPIPTLANFGQNSNQLPDKFPIILKPKVGDGKIINEGSSEFFELFKLVRTGTIPSMEISGFSQFPISVTDNRNPSNVIFNEYHFTIKATAKGIAPKTQRFKFTFSHDQNGIPSFDIEKTITAD